MCVCVCERAPVYVCVFVLGHATIFQNGNECLHSNYFVSNFHIYFCVKTCNRSIHFSLFECCRRQQRKERKSDEYVETKENDTFTAQYALKKIYLSVAFCLFYKQNSHSRKINIFIITFAQSLPVPISLRSYLSNDELMSIELSCKDDAKRRKSNEFLIYIFVKHSHIVEYDIGFV